MILLKLITCINSLWLLSLSFLKELLKQSHKQVSFIVLVKICLGSIEEKLNYLSNSLIRLCFAEIGRSLFKADRLTYSLHFIKGVFPHLFGKNEWEFFSGTVVASSDSHMQLPRWATKDRKEIFSMFVNTFSHIIPNMQFENEGIWAQFMKSNQPEKEFPAPVVNKITPFQRCLLI